MHAYLWSTPPSKQPEKGAPLCTMLTKLFVSMEPFAPFFQNAAVNPHTHVDWIRLQWNTVGTWLMSSRMERFAKPLRTERLAAVKCVDCNCICPTRCHTHLPLTPSPLSLPTALRRPLQWKPPRVQWLQRHPWYIVTRGDVDWRRWLIYDLWQIYSWTRLN